VHPRTRFIYKALLCTKSYVIVFLFFVSYVFAADVEVNPAYVVSGIEAYSEDEDSDSAEISATDKAKAEATNILIQRLLPSSYISKFQYRNIENFNKCMLDIDFESSRVTATSFHGIFTVLYKEACIKRLLNRMGIYFANTYAEPAIIIPIFEQGTKVQIWDNSEYFLKYQKLVNNYGLSSFAYILGDLSDVYIINPADLMQDGFCKTCQKIRAKYGVSGIYIMYLQEQKNKIIMSVFVKKDKVKEVFHKEIGFKSPEEREGAIDWCFDNIVIIVDDYYKKGDLL
jgi:hypothetical protein